MSMLEFPIRRYQFTLVTFLLLVAIGWFTFTTIPREEDPSFKMAAFQIAAILPGADPTDLERLVTKPIEDRFAELDDLRNMESVITDGVSFTVVEFEAYADPDKKYDEVTREINALRATLPTELRELTIRKISPALVNIVQYALVSADAPYRELEDLARDLKDTLKAVPGVRTAESWAYPPRELRIELDLQRMAELGLTAGQVIQAVQSENADIPAGVVDLGPRSFSLKTSGGYTDLEQVRDTVVSTAGGNNVRVRDLAAVRWDEGQWGHIGRYSGQRAVFVSANMKEGFNILTVRRSIDTAVERFDAALPGRVKLELGFDQSRNVASRLNRLYLDFSIAIALVMLTLLPLGWRAAGIVMISIPLSLAFGITVLYFLGYSLNQLSIAGFVVALGLLVDDSIVAIENISRHLRMGYDRIQAAIAGTRQICVAILGCTATLIFAFLPLIVLPGNAGKFIRVLPTAVVATIIGSLLIALFIIPFLASRLLDQQGDPHGNRFLQRVMGAIHRYYRPALHYCLARPKATVITAIGGTLLLSFALVLLIGSSLFPKADTPQFLIQIEAPDGTSLAETDRALRFVEDRLATMPEVKSWFANLGHGNPLIYYNQLMRNESPNYAEVFAILKDYDTRRTPQRLDELRSQLDRYPAARITVKEFVNGPPITAPIAVRVVGPDLQMLDRLSRQVERLVDATPGTRDVKNPLRIARTNLRLGIDSQKAALLGVPTVEFDRAVRLAVSGVEAGKYQDDSGEQYSIVVRTPVAARADLETLELARIPTLTGASLPLSQLATLQFEQAPVQISRYDRERAVTINSQVERGWNTARVTAAVVGQLEQMSWPRGYRYVLGGDAEAGAEAFGGIGTAIIVAIFGIFAILVLEFGSFRSTLIVLTVVPLGIFGGLLMLLVTGNDISFTASIGFIALIGIEIKNSILLVDFTNQLREQGVSLDEAIEQAGEIRFLPILLTSATAIGGLLPLALQNTGLYSPMAWVIIGGLITSTFLARLVTPVMYKLLPPAGHEPLRQEPAAVAQGASGALL
ncbi:MAG: efflux RND transporter permease subunit [Sinobacteraceae bacterium]|nr:efflux RND transporter permease subunit [Nevskiaceae bacterium]MCP5338682.1 efflux RND transporter permease subunit [Nevskiaceae bacterium]MCP5473007.1 efflux RND transporter permease subunit [Nevskiaceae bacterium]